MHPKTLTAGLCNLRIPASYDNLKKEILEFDVHIDQLLVVLRGDSVGQMRISWPFPFSCRKTLREKLFKEKYSSHFAVVLILKAVMSISRHSQPVSPSSPRYPLPYLPSFMTCICSILATKLSNPPLQCGRKRQVKTSSTACRYPISCNRSTIML